MAKGPIVEKREITAIRIPPSQKAEIKRRAEALRMTFTEYVISAALDQLPIPDDVRDRLDEHEKRIAELERLRELSF